MRKRGMLRSDRRGLIVYPLVFLLVLLLSALFVGRSLTIHRLRHELADLRTSLKVAQEEGETLRARLALRDDRRTIEELARERLGLVKPGEEKIIFVGE